MPRGESDFYYSQNISGWEWYDNKSILLLATNVDGMSSVSNVMRQTKSSATKISAPCPNVIKFCNNGMDGVDIMDQKTAACRLEVNARITWECFFIS